VNGRTPDTVLVRALRRVLPAERVLTRPSELYLYRYDATDGETGLTPEAVALPQTTAEVAGVVRAAHESGAPVYPRGAGTSLSGGAVPARGGIVLSTAAMDRVLDLDVADQMAVVQPGVVLQQLDDLAATHGLMYPPDPGSVATATVGGSIAECSGGLRGLKYGVTKHYVTGLEVVLADGRILRLGGKTTKNVTGYDLIALFVGSEGTLGVVTEATLRLVPKPAARATLSATFARAGAALESVAGIVAAGVLPATLEFIDAATLRFIEDYVHAGLPVDAAALLLIEVDGPPEQVQREAEVAAGLCAEHGGLVERAADDEARERLWAARRAAYPSLVNSGRRVIVEDATVPRSRVPEMLAAVEDIAARNRVTVATAGHAGDGNLHPSLLVDPRDEGEMERARAAIGEIFGAALRLGGTLSGEHGIGSVKAAFLGRQLGETGLGVTRAIKDALDPQGILNPGKFVP
jgi:glycolate oxidase